MVVSSLEYGTIEKPNLMKVVTTSIPNSTATNSSNNNGSVKHSHIHNYKSPFPTLSTNEFAGLFFNHNENAIDIVLFNLFHRLYSNRTIKPFQPIQSVFISCQVYLFIYFILFLENVEKKIFRS